MHLITYSYRSIFSSICWSRYSRDCRLFWSWSRLFCDKSRPRSRSWLFAVSVFIGLAVTFGWHLVVTEKEQVDSQDYSEHEYELVMQHPWHILSKILVLCFCSHSIERFCLPCFIRWVIYLDSLWISLFVGCTKSQGKVIWEKNFLQVLSTLQLFGSMSQSSDAENTSKFSCMGWLLWKT